jgi:hypothetical protein
MTLSIDTTKPASPDVQGPTNPGSVVRRVLVVYEEGRAGTMALREAAQLASAGAELVVLTLAPQAKPLGCCKGGGAGPYNCAVRDAAAEELRQARMLLGPHTHASFTTLVGTPEPPLVDWSARQSFDTIVVPGRRLTRGGGRLARQLRQATRADVRAVS